MGFAGVGKAEILAPDSGYVVFILTSAAIIRASHVEKMHVLRILVSSLLSRLVSLG